MSPIIPICLVYLFFMGKSLYEELKDKPNKLLSFFEKQAACSKCLGFWLTLLLTWNIPAAVGVSMFFGVLSYFFPLNK